MVELHPWDPRRAKPPRRHRSLPLDAYDRMLVAWFHAREYDQELNILDSGQMLYTHNVKQCVGRWCAIHKPMPGPWSDWPRQWREDRGIMERVCPHGTGHPVAESWAYWRDTGQTWQWTHGCCEGCPCHPPVNQQDHQLWELVYGTG